MFAYGEKIINCNHPAGKLVLKGLTSIAVACKENKLTLGDMLRLGDCVKKFENIRSKISYKVFIDNWRNLWEVLCNISILGITSEEVLFPIVDEFIFGTIFGEGEKSEYIDDNDFIDINEQPRTFGMPIEYAVIDLTL